MVFENINPATLDMLKEVGNIGAGHAATALSKLLHEPAEMKVPSARMLSFDEVAEMLGRPEQPVASVYIRIEGRVPGNMFFLLSFAEALTIIGHLTGVSSPSVEKTFSSALSMSALQEAGNIVVGSYVSALSDLTNIELQMSPPAVGIDMAGAILGSGLTEVSQYGDCAIIVDTALSVNKLATQINGHFLLLFAPKSIRKLSEALGIELHE